MSKIKALYHIVFATKKRQGTLNDSFMEDLHSMICATAKSKNSYVVCINSVSDHIHILLDLASTVALSDLMAAIKSQSSLWLHSDTRSSHFEGWGEGYYACSVSPSMADGVKKYIVNQTEHHKITLFNTEISAMCERWMLSYHPSDLC